MSRKSAFAAMLPVPQNWTDQDLIVYHGTTDASQPSILAGVQVAFGHSQTDFGMGFYTTTNLDQARVWANRMSLRHPGTLPVVIQLTLSRASLATLQSLWFVRADQGADDYWSLVHYCRTGGTAHARNVQLGWYDVAIGRLATSWQRRKIRPELDWDQVSFHTPDAELLLNNSPKVVVP